MLAGLVGRKPVVRWGRAVNRTGQTAQMWCRGGNSMEVYVKGRKKSTVERDGEKGTKTDGLTAEGA